MMKIETCYNYFEFLNNECDRYLKDDEITEEEIAQLEIELDRFIEKTENSDLPTHIKNIISTLTLNYTHRPKREYIALLGKWDFTKDSRRGKLKKKVEDFKFQITDLLLFIKMNY